MKEDFPKLSYACPKLWESMHGDERARFCETCRHKVVNLSAMTAEDRRAALANARASGERLCGMYYRRLNGDFVSAEAPLSAAERRRVIPASLAATVSAGAFALAASCLTAKAAEGLAPRPAPVPVAATGSPAVTNEETPIVLQAFGMIEFGTNSERRAISRLVDRRLGMKFVDLAEAPDHSKSKYVVILESEDDGHFMTVVVRKQLWFWEIVPGTLKPR